ncbi:cobalamin-dependent protein, partial [Bradyrhizobium sp. UFLA05-153]
MARLALVTIRNQLAFGPRTLHRVADRAGHQVASLFIGDHFLDPRPITDAQLALTVDWVRHMRAEVVGISLTSYAFTDAVRLSVRLRALARPPLVVWGGHHPTIAPEDCAVHCDVMCRGEGENALLDLLAAIDAGATCDALLAIPNIAGHDASGRLL